MQRFVYVPRVEAYIRLEEENRIVDVSDDIISGSIQLRLNAMSEAELTLQNKHGRYARSKTYGGTHITPMDRIIIRMSRVGQPENVFAGYIDGSPHYQIYSGPVTIRASCVLKLLQHTYFDPGLMSMASMFQKYGWVPIDTSGDLISKEHFDAMDSTGSVKDLITGMLIDVAEWSPSMIQIRDLPPKLIQDIGTIMVAEEEELTKEYQEVLKRLGQFFAIDTSGGAIDVGGIGPGGSAVPVTGNVPPEDIAALLMDNGLDVDTTTKLVAIARRESGWRSDAINYNGGGDTSSGDGSYDFGLFQINTIHAPNATDNGRGLSGPGSSASQADLKAAIGQQPQWVQDFAAQMFDPRLSTKKAAEMAKASPSLSPWVPNGGKHGETWQTGISNEWIQQAAKATQDALSGRKPSTTPTPTKRPEEGTGVKSEVSYKLTHITDGLGSGNWGAIDLFVPGGKTAGAAVYAVEGGTVVHNGSAVRRDGSPNGQSLTLRGTSGQQYWYGHIENPSPVGTTVQAGQQIAVVSANHEAPHLHIGFENKAVGTTVTVAAAALSGTGSPGTGGGIGGAGGVTGTTPTTQNQLTPGAVADIARQTFFTLQTGAFDLLESNLLRGERAIANDVSLLQWLGTVVNGAGRVFTSDALGNFRAFFPDYFGYYGSNNNGQTPTFFISEIEILDLTIQQSDNDLTTHVFGVGPILSGGTGLSIYDKLLSTVASVEKPAFRWFLTIDEETDFDPAKFLKKYGARPYTHEMPLVGKRELIWMGSWMKFLELWSRRFTSNAQFTFMPEIRPGWLLNIGNRVQMFVQSVSHTFSYSGGFSTSCELTSAASLTDDITWLPRAGLESVIDQIPASDPINDLPENDPNILD